MLEECGRNNQCEDLVEAKAIPKAVSQNCSDKPFEALQTAWDRAESKVADEIYRFGQITIEEREKAGIRS
jgi:hypothetical protein